jgi:hypothetical protein
LRSQQAARNGRAAQETLKLLQVCLSNHRERGYPATLDACADLSPRTTRSSGYRFEYLPAAPGADGRVGAYLLCAQPLSFRATGFETVVADSTGVTWEGRAMEEATVQDPPTCASVLGAERAIAWCAFSFAAHDPARAYPRRLADIAGCVSDRRKLASIGPDRLTDGDGESYAYLASVPKGMGSDSRFRIYRLGRSAGKARWSDDTLGLSQTKAPASGPVLNRLPGLEGPGQWFLACNEGRAEDCFAAGVEWQSYARQSEGSQSASAARSMREKAIKAFTRGCELNEMRSCNWLASEFESGKDVARDLPRSVALHERACTLGDALGCSSAAGMLERNDTARAVALYVRACDLDDPGACFVAARLLAAGEGMVADRERALALFSRACNDGMAPACSRAASLSPTEAEAFRHRACVLGAEEECQADRDPGAHLLHWELEADSDGYGHRVAARTLTVSRWRTRPSKAMTVHRNRTRTSCERGRGPGDSLSQSPCSTGVTFLEPRSDTRSNMSRLLP